ncbi:MAG: MFS transporter [Firmicutes bacterium]|nr:MFS transporter [Bacillota bacterium]MCL5039294.1 MFS transporter [Bacillota bacterium]
MEKDTHLSENIRTNNRQGLFSSLAQNMVGPFTGIYALKLGASNMQVAMLSSLPALLALVGMIPGSLLVERQRNKKLTTALLLLGTRSFYLFMAAVPFFPEAYRPALLVAAVALMNLPGAIAGVAWQSMMAGVIPEAQRGRAFAQRNQYMVVAGTVAVLITGRLLDLLGHPAGYQVFFGLAFLMALGEAGFLLQLREASSLTQVNPSSSDPEALPENLVRPEDGRPQSHLAFLSNTRLGGRQNRPYLDFLGSTLLLYFGWQMGWPLFLKYQVTLLGANNSWLSYFNLASAVVSFFGYPLWGQFSDKRGARVALIYASAGLGLVPVFFSLSTSLYQILLINIYTGFVASGLNLLLFNGLLEVTPEDGRTTHIAFYNTLVNLSATIAPVVAMALYDRIGVHQALYVASAFRFLGAAAIYLKNNGARRLLQKETPTG